MLYTTLLKTAFRALHGPTPPRPPGDAGSGLVLVADGVGGLDLCGTGLVHAAAKAGMSHEIRVMAWGHGFGRWHRDLTNVENHRLWASRMVDQVAEFRARRPGAPVFLVGKSGGTGVVVKALEGLPEGAVEAAVLLSSALSPGYDLTRALRAVRRELVLFWSPLDVIVLGVGTRLFGTIDRVNAVSAGLVGFKRPGNWTSRAGPVRQVAADSMVPGDGRDGLSGRARGAGQSGVPATVCPSLVKRCAAIGGAPGARVKTVTRRADNLMARRGRGGRSMRFDPPLRVFQGEPDASRVAARTDRPVSLLHHDPAPPRSAPFPRRPGRESGGRDPPASSRGPGPRGSPLDRIRIGPI